MYAGSNPTPASIFSITCTSFLKLSPEVATVFLPPVSKSTDLGCYLVVGVVHQRVPQIILVCIIHTINSRELIRLLEAAGWQLVRVRGSHHQFKNPAKPGLVTVPHPKKDLGTGLVKAILKQAGIRQGGK